MKRLILLAYLFLLSTAGNAQLDMTLSSMTELWQHNQLNPAHRSKDGFTIALPEIYFGFNHSGEPFKDIWEVEDDILVLDTRKWVDNLDPQNEVFSRFRLNTIQLARSKNNFTWSLGHSFRNQTQINYTRDLISLIHDGNAGSIGDTLDLSTNLNWLSASDFEFGVAWKINNLTIGAKAHYLNGIQYVETERSDVSLITHDDIYQLEFITDMRLRSSSFLSSEDISALDFEFTGLETYDMFTKNSGWSFDLGAIIEVSDNVKAEFSVSDLGYIKWKDVDVYESKGSHTYAGADLDDIADFDSLSFEEALDTIGHFLEFEESSESDYKMSLAPRIYLGLELQLNPRLSMQGAFVRESFNDKAYHAYGLGLQYEIFDWWRAGTMVSHRLDKINWGINSSMRLGFVELFFASDNILSVFGLNNLGNSNGRAGINLIFNKDDDNL